MVTSPFVLHTHSLIQGYSPLLVSLSHSPVPPLMLQLPPWLLHLFLSLSKPPSTQQPEGSFRNTNLFFISGGISEFIPIVKDANSAEIYRAEMGNKIQSCPASTLNFLWLLVILYVNPKAIDIQGLDLVLPFLPPSLSYP